MRHIEKDKGDGGGGWPRDDGTQGQVTGKKEKEGLEISCGKTQHSLSLDAISTTRTTGTGIRHTGHS